VKKIETSANRMYKRQEIEHPEALSKVSYQNAVEFFTSQGIKGSDDVEKIDFYKDAIRKSLKALQP
jgi:glycerol-3-phosphate O-acyltransferase